MLLIFYSYYIITLNRVICCKGAWLFFSILAECSQKVDILALFADCDTQAVATKLHIVAIAHNDALIDQIVIDGCSICHLCEEDVGLCGVHLLADRQVGEGCHHFATFLQNGLHPVVYLIGIFQNLECLLLGEEVDVVRVFHLIEYIYNLLAGKCHAQTDGSTTPCLTHRVEHDEVGIFCQLQAVGAGLGKVAIGFIDYYDAVEA